MLSMGNTFAWWARYRRLNMVSEHIKILDDRAHLNTVVSLGHSFPFLYPQDGALAKARCNECPIDPLYLFYHLHLPPSASYWGVLRDLLLHFKYVNQPCVDQRFSSLVNAARPTRCARSYRSPLDRTASMLWEVRASQHPSFSTLFLLEQHDTPLKARPVIFTELSALDSS